MEEKELNLYYEQISDAEVSLVEKGKFATTYQLAKYPDRNVMSSTLVFLPFATIITGDLRIANHGVQALGYGLDWFTGEMEPDYLAGKFLEKRWQPDAARAAIKARIRQIYQEAQEEHERVKAELTEMNGSAPSSEEVAQAMDPLYTTGTWRFQGEKLRGNIADALEKLLSFAKTNPDVFESASLLWAHLPTFQENSHSAICPFDPEWVGRSGMDYEPGEFGWLAAIQRRFHECWTVMEGCLP